MIPASAYILEKMGQKNVFGTAFDFRSTRLGIHIGVGSLKGFQMVMALGGILYKSGSTYIYGMRSRGEKRDMIIYTCSNLYLQ